MTTTLDPAKTSANVTLSNGNLTATRGAGGPFYASTSSQAHTGSAVYAEVIGGITDAGIGLSNAAIADDATGAGTGWIGATTTSIGLWTSDIYQNGALLGSMPVATAAGDIIGIALDLAVTNTMAFRNVTQNSAWTADFPTTGLGAGPLFLTITMGNSIARTVNFNTTFTGPPEAGFTRWDGSPWTLVYTLPAAVRATVLTGIAAGTLFGRKFPAVVNAFTVTRFAAILQRNVPLPAAVRAFVVTGLDANLVAAIPKRLTADVGAVVLSGVVAATTVARKLIADVGAVTLTGSLAALLRALLMAATTGAVTLTGFATTLARALMLAASAGAVTLTGLAANLVRTTVGNFILVANAGAVLLTGLAANLVRVVIGGVTMPAECGVVMLAGMPVALRIAGGIPVIPETPQPGPMNFGRRVVLWHNRW